MLDTPCSEVVWRVLATHSIRQFPLHFPARASPCAITFQQDSTTTRFALYPHSVCVCMCVCVCVCVLNCDLPGGLWWICGVFSWGRLSSKFVIRVVLLLIVMFCVLFVCKCVLPPVVNPIAVDKHININISGLPTALFGDQCRPCQCLLLTGPGSSVSSVCRTPYETRYRSSMQKVAGQGVSTVTIGRRTDLLTALTNVWL
jgi:hypothetical protein